MGIKGEGQGHKSLPRTGRQLVDGSRESGLKNMEQRAEQKKDLLKSWPDFKRHTLLSSGLINRGINSRG